MNISTNLSINTLISNDLHLNYNDWTFVNVFKRKGVQAICGTLTKKLKFDSNNTEHDINQSIVYKVGAHPERSLEHEEYIMKECNKLREVSPHFVYLYHSKDLNITNKFIDDNGKYSCNCENCKCEKKNKKEDTLFTISNEPKEYKCRKVLFIEYVSNIHLKHALRSNDDHLSACQLIMSMAAIQQGIEFNGLCHYDLHIDNILLKECDPHSYFAYKFKNGKTLLTPTRGYYPVFIDFGTSYIHSYIKPENNNNCKTSVINTHNGLQSTVFDKFIDAHQLIFSSMFELEKISERYHYISTLFMKYFKHVTVYRETGWKKLPFDIFNQLLNKLEDFDPEIENIYPIMQTQQSDLIEILSLSIPLPFKPASDDTIKGFCKKYNLKYKNNGESTDYMIGYLFKQLCIQITNIQRSLNLIKASEDDCNINEDEIYYILREIVECKDSQSAELLRNKYKMGKKCELKKCWNIIQDLSIFLSSIYYQYFRTHEDIINELYKNVSFQDSIDIAYFLQKNIPIRPTKLGLVDVYCYDSTTNCIQVKQMDTTDYKPGKQWLTQKCNTLFQ